MKPYGRVKKLTGFKSKIDWHIRYNGRKVLNWWEVGLTYVTKKRVRMMAKEEINKELNG